MSGKQLNIFGDEAVGENNDKKKQLGICENCDKPVYDDEVYCNPDKSTIYFHGHTEIWCVVKKYAIVDDTL